ASLKYVPSNERPSPPNPLSHGGERGSLTATPNAQHPTPNTQTGTWYLDNLVARTEGATITGNGTLTAGNLFTAHARAENVNLELPGPYPSEYVNVRGTSTIASNLSGQVREGTAENLSGALAVATNELTSTAEKLWELNGVARLKGPIVAVTPLSGK